MELTSSPEPVAPAGGYSTRHVSSPADVERRASGESAAYGSSVSTETWRLIRERLPGYQTELDLLAIAPDGAGASAITCWYDARTRCGEIEAVGTAPAHRRRGLCRSLIIEGLRRLRLAGATHAVVQTIANAPAIALYQACGFAMVGTDHAWAKPL
jgi:GNAT superfamily N-acetyltransferase